MSLDRNPKTINIDKANSLEIVELMNNEDKKIAYEVEKVKYDIAKAIDMMEKTLKNSGRIIYLGSGTSGKQAVIDASECPPTFGIDDNTIKAVISGGIESVGYWKEETEDNLQLAIEDLKKEEFSDKDILIVISASGNTPYAISAVEYAKKIGSKIIGVFCNDDAKIKTMLDIEIVVDVGAEVIAGSTRLKAGTAQKMILNMLSTGVMIRTGHVYSNLMIYLKPINQKLKNRLIDIVSIITKKNISEVKKVLERTNYNVNQTIKILEKRGLYESNCKWENNIKR